MNENTSMKDELLARAGIYLDEQAKMITRTLRDYKDIPDACLKCGDHLKEIYERPEELTHGPNDFDIVVLKCEKCVSYYAFWIEPFAYDEWVLTPAKEDEHMGGRLMAPPQWKYVGKPEWGEGKKPKFPAEITKAYKRTVSLIALNRKLNTIVQSKLSEMYKNGLSTDTINLARDKATKYLTNNPATSKQLGRLFASAIYESSREVGEKVTERQLQEISGVTRKTIRMWRKRLRATC